MEKKHSIDKLVKELIMTSPYKGSNENVIAKYQEDLRHIIYVKDMLQEIDMELAHRLYEIPKYIVEDGHMALNKTNEDDYIIEVRELIQKILESFKRLHELAIV